MSQIIRESKITLPNVRQWCRDGWKKKKRCLTDFDNHWCAKLPHFSFSLIMVTLTCTNGTSYAWTDLGDSRISGCHFTRAVGLFFMGNFNRGSPLVQETAGCVEAAVSHTCLSLKVLTHPITIVVVAHAWLVCSWEENRKECHLKMSYYL